MRDSVRGTPWEGIVMAGLSQLSPINHIQNGMPPFLFVHGTSDALVPFDQSTQMCDRMRKIGATCEVLPVEGGGHGIRWWESYPRLAAAYKRKMITWLQTQLAPAVVKS
jgi:dipeptidyl aminopeptidase/acylaminoacyl peptidase